VVTTEATKKIDLDQLLGIDQAILHSIDSCGNANQLFSNHSTPAALKYL